MITTEKKSLPVGKYVNTEHVDTVIRTYKKERWIHNSQRLGKEDSLSAWYTVEELEGFIQTIKKHGADGIKFYFGAYPHDDAPKPEYAGLQTIVLVATRSKETENGIINKDIYITKENKTQILAYNVSYLCPPLCGGGGGGLASRESELGGLGVALLDRGEEGFSVI